MGVVTAIWLHQWNLAGLTSWEQLRQQWPGTVYVKALDGTSWMRDFDPSPLACNGFLGHEGDLDWRWAHQNAIPWTVPTNESIEEEATLNGLLAEEAGEVILDLEPYEQFWQPADSEPTDFHADVIASTSAPVAVTLDYRRLPWPGREILGHSDRLLPQCYWPTFQRPWRVVLDGARSALEPYGKPIEYVLPGDADPDDLRAALSWVEAHGATASIWLWQTITPENWEVIIENAADQPPAMPTVDDLVNLLGYLQGDVATAIEDGIRAGLLAKTARERRAKLTAALDAVMTLRNAGK